MRQAFAELQKSLPQGVQLRIVHDQSELVQSSLSGVGRAVLLGAFFVVLVLFALLGDLRAALVVTLTIPLAIGLAGILLREANVGLDRGSDAAHDLRRSGRAEEGSDAQPRRDRKGHARAHGTEIERPLAIVMIGGLMTSTLFALPTFHAFVHHWQERLGLAPARGPA